MSQSIYFSHMPITWLALLVLQCFSFPVASQKFTPNYDESAVPQYTLPNLLVMNDGEPVTTPAQWAGHRRGELLELFEEHMFGALPGNPFTPKVEVLESTDKALDGLARRSQVRVTFSQDKPDVFVDLLIYTPADATEPVPTFVTLNFQGNHTTQPDPAIRISEAWIKSRGNGIVTKNRANEKGRGVSANRWPVQTIINRGYGLVTAYYGELDPDFDDDFKNGVHSLFPREGKENEWATISGWAWGLHRIADYLVTNDTIDADRLIVMGHSRLGKAALWAGATDPRFAAVISNNSGCGGAALSRRAYGETLLRINGNFPHWFNNRFKQYNKKEGELPMDQHGLIALIAPRPVLVSSAQDDRWADPLGEFLSAYHASPVYELFGGPGLTSVDFPKPKFDSLIGEGRLVYRHRPGKHDVTAEDWQAYMSFADRLVKCNADAADAADAAE